MVVTLLFLEARVAELNDVGVVNRWMRLCGRTQWGFIPAPVGNMWLSGGKVLRHRKSRYADPVTFLSSSGPTFSNTALSRLSSLEVRQLSPVKLDQVASCTCSVMKLWSECCEYPYGGRGLGLTVNLN